MSRVSSYCHISRFISSISIHKHGVFNDIFMKAFLRCVKSCRFIQLGYSFVLFSRYIFNTHFHFVIFSSGLSIFKYCHLYLFRIKTSESSQSFRWRLGRNLKRQLCMTTVCRFRCRDTVGLINFVLDRTAS